MITLLKRHGYFFLATILAIAALLVVGFVLIKTTSGKNFFSNIVNQYSPALFFIRMVLYILIIGLWPVILKRAVKTKSDSASRYYYLALLIIAIAVYEIVIVQRVPIRVYHLLSG